MEFKLCCMPQDDFSLLPRQGLSQDYKIYSFETQNIAQTL